MSTKSAGTAVKDAAENLKKASESKGAGEIEALARKIGLKKHADKALAVKDTTSTAFGEKIELVEEATAEGTEKKSFLKRGLKSAIGVGFGVLMGKEILSGKEKDAVVDTVDEGVDIVTDEKRLKEVNDTVETTMKAQKDIEIAEEKLDKKWKFKHEKIEFWKKAEKYTAKDYGIKNVMSESWAQTEFEIDEETGVPKKRNLFWRVLAFFPAVIRKWKTWKSFEQLKESGALDKMKKAKLAKEDAEAKVKEAGEKLEKGMETKREAFSSVFVENPGALPISQNYFKKLARLLGNAEKYPPKSPLLAKEIKKIGDEAGQAAVKKLGPNVGKMQGFKKYLPGISLKKRGGFMVVEIVGKALGAAFREGSKEGGWARASNTFKQEIFNWDTVKDATPGVGTWRSFKRLDNEDNIPKWSKWLDFGLSAGMDAAMAVGIVASLGTLSAPLVAARMAAGTAAKGGVRKLAMRQIMRQGVKRSVSKGARKGFTKQAVRAAGGKWGFRLNLMMTTVTEFFGDDVEQITEEVKIEARDVLLTPEQKRSLQLMKGKLPPEQEVAVLADEDKKQKEEITHDEVRKDAGVLSESSVQEKEEKEQAPIIKLNPKKNLEKNESQSTMGKSIKMAKEEIITKIAA